jgi:O-antigen/teichoic acid export membrane protein
VADQAVSSLSNLAVGVFVARSLGSAGFGAFSLVFLTYAFVLSGSRGLSTDPMLVRFSNVSVPAWRRAVSAATATALVIGLVVGAACAVLGLAIPGLRGGLVALGACTWGLLLQDSCRFAFFAAGRPAAALVNDLLWGVLLVASLALLSVSDRTSVATTVLALGATATIAAVVALAHLRVRPNLALVPHWLSDHRDLGTRYLVENVAIGGARQIRFFVIGAVAGLAAVGAVRGGEIFMGPFLVLVMGVSQVAVPEAAQVLGRNPARLLRFCGALGSVAAAMAAAWGALVVTLLPLGLGALMLGPLWVPAAELLPPIIIAFVLGGFEIAAAAGVRALGAASRSLTAQLITAGLYLVLGGGGALVAGAPGSCWGVAVATLLGACAWWVQLHRAHAEHMDAVRRGATLPNALKEAPHA